MYTLENDNNENQIKNRCPAWEKQRTSFFLRIQNDTYTYIHDDEYYLID